MFPWSWEGSFGCWLTLIFSLHHLVVPSLHGSTDQSTFLLKEHPSVRRARPPVGWHSTAEHELHTTTVCECEKTVVIVKQPWHLTSMKNEFGLCTNLFFLCFCFSNSCSWVRWGFCVSFPGTCGHFRSYRLDVLHVRSFYVWVRSLVFRPMGLVSDVDRVGMGFWFLFFFPFPSSSPSFVVFRAFDRACIGSPRLHHVHPSFPIDRLVFLFSHSHDGTVRRSNPRFSRPTRVWLVSFLPSFLPSFVLRFHAPWVGAADRCPLGAPWRRWFGVVRRRTCKRTPTPPAAQSVSVPPARKDRSSSSLPPPGTATHRERRGRGGAGREGVKR